MLPSLAPALVAAVMTTSRVAAPATGAAETGAAAAPAAQAPVSPPPTLPATPKRLYREGDQLLAAGEHAAALAAFTDGVRVSTQLGDDRWLAYFRGALVQCHIEAHAVDGDPVHLRLARGHLERAMSGASELTDADREELTNWAAQAEALLAEREQSARPVEPAEVAEVAEPERFDPVEDGETSLPESDEPNWRVVGGSLVAAGAVTAVFGIGGVIYGARGRSIVEDQADGPLGPVQMDYVDNTVPRLQTTWYAVGGTSIVLGTAATTIGAIVLAKHSGRRREARRAQLGGIVSPRVVGLRLSGRF